MPQFATADTDFYDGESALSQLTDEPQYISKSTTTSVNTLAKPQSVFTLESPAKKHVRGKSKPPLHTKVQTEVMTNAKSEGNDAGAWLMRRMPMQGETTARE